MPDATTLAWSWPSLDAPSEAAEAPEPVADEREAGVREEAERVLAQAHEQAEQLRECVRREAWEQARAEAAERFDAVLHECLAQQVAAFDAARAEFVTAAQTAADERLQVIERDLAGVIAALAEQVIRRTVEAEDRVVLDVVGAAIAEATGAHRLTVRVPAPQEPLVREAMAELLAAAEGAEELEVIADSAIGPGGCIVETERGRFDARIETQIELLSAEVARLLGSPGSGRGELPCSPRSDPA
jgi:flagellar biosynthesis/type III secretory pathway protein FliH